VRSAAARERGQVVGFAKSVHRADAAVLGSVTVRRVLIVGLIAVTACGNTRAAPDAGSCVGGVRWRAGAYIDRGELAPLRRGGVLGEAAASCEPDSSARRTIYRIPGVDPALAVSDVSKGQNRLLVAMGYLTQLRSHPLHRQLYGRNDGALPVKLRCGRRFEMTGKASWPTDPLVLERRSDGVELRLRPDARARIGRRHGVPYVRRGQRLRVVGRRCVARNGTRLRVVDLIEAPTRETSAGP